MFPHQTPRRDAYACQFGSPSPTLLALAQAVLLARASEQAVRPRIEALHRQVLQQHGYHVDPHWVGLGLYAADQTRILEPGQAYEMPAEQLDGYQARCEALYRAAGYDVPAGQCPLLLVENARRQAELTFGLACRELRLNLDPEEVREEGTLWAEFVQLMLAIVLPPPPAERDPIPGVR